MQSKPTPAQEAMNNYLIYQEALDNHQFEDEADKMKLQDEANFWYQAYLKNTEQDQSLLLELGFVTQ